MGLQERFEKHWLGTVVLVAVVVGGGTWTVLNQVLVRPRDEELARLERRLEELDGKGRSASPAAASKQGPSSASDGEGGGVSRLQSPPSPGKGTSTHGASAVPIPAKFPVSPMEPKTDKQDLLVFSDGEYLRATVVSVQRNGGRAVVTLNYENLSNSEYRAAIYNGGAGGKDTMLIDGSGEKWGMARRNGIYGPEGIVFLPHLPTKVMVAFDKASGDPDVKSFTLINYVHILQPTSNHFAEVIIKNIPSSISG